MNKTEEKILLNGKWNYITDPRGKYSFNEIQQLCAKKKLSGEMTIPINWQLAGLNNYSGVVWFFKEFDSKIFKKNAGSPQILHFKGVDYFADVWLNKKYLGHHEGYFQPFSFIIDYNTLSKEKNLLIVKVDSPKEQHGIVWPHKKKLIKGIFNHHDCRPGGWSFEYGQDQNTGGIWNDVYISLDGLLSIDKIKVTPHINWKSNKAAIKVDLLVTSPCKIFKPVIIDYEVISPDGKKISKHTSFTIKKGSQKPSFSITINNPQLWWSWDLGSPNLYTLRISSEHFHEQSIQFGIRER